MEATRRDVAFGDMVNEWMVLSLLDVLSRRRRLTHTSHLEEQVIYDCNIAVKYSIEYFSS